MKVAKNVVVSIAYQVRTEDGVLVDEAPANQPLYACSQRALAPCASKRQTRDFQLSVSLLNAKEALKKSMLSTCVR